MASLFDSRASVRPRLDAEGVSWPRVPLCAAVRMDWARVRRFRIAKQVASWEDDRGGKHARSVPDRELRVRLDEAWSEELIERMSARGQLRIAVGSGGGGTASWYLTALVFLLLAAALMALELVVGELDPRTLRKSCVVAALGVAGAGLMLVQAGAQRRVAGARAVRLDPEGLHLRDRAGGWRLVLSSRRGSERGPRRWGSDPRWLFQALPLEGLGGVPLLLFIGWGRRAGCCEPAVPSWDLARACRRSGRRVVLLWAPLLGVAAAVHQGTVSAPQPAPWLFGLLAGLGPAAFGAACWWLGRRYPDRWDELGRRADELLARLGW